MHPNDREWAKDRIAEWRKKAAAAARLTQQQIDGEPRNAQADVTRRAVVTHKRFALRREELLALAIALAVTAIVAAVLWRLS